jgi:3-oxoadipate enol-lactonase
LVLADTFAVHPDGQAVYERSLAGSRDLPAMAEARVDFLLAQPANPEVRREVVETMSRIDPAAYCIGAEAVWIADQRDRVAEITVPTLVICGDEDQPTPPELSRELHEAIAGSRLEMIPNAGHLTNLEQPDAFNSAVERFLAQVEQP